MFEYESRFLPGGIAIVRVWGSLNDENREYFFKCVSELINDGHPSVIIDCRDLGFVTSTGLAGLVNARRQAQARSGKIYLTHLNTTIVEILHITKLSKLFAIYPTTNQLLFQLGLSESEPVADSLSMEA